MVLIAVLYGVMFLQGTMSPKLGLDLSGGTTVTLTPVTLKGQRPSDQNIDEAVNIIRQRVNAFGVSEAQVTKQSENIIVAVPGQGQRQVVQQVGQTAQLRFRQVLLYQPAGLSSQLPQQPAQKSSQHSKESKKGQKSSSQDSAGKGRALSHALLAQPSPKPKAPAPPQQGGLAGQDTSGIHKQVLKKFRKLDCRHPDKTRTSLKPQNEQVVACDRQGGAKYVLSKSKIPGTMVDNAQAGLPQNGQTGGWQVNLSFNGEGADRFAALTQKVVNLPPPRNQVAIVLDGVVASAPRIISAISGGQAQITGDFTQQQAQDLANVLRYGALPLKFNKSAIQSVSPTLGKDQLRGGLLAGAVGLLLVLLYSLLYYRGLGLVSGLSLACAGLITYAAICLLGMAMNFRLSLAGIAGIIVAIGITADSFVVFFERLRDEIREGRSARSAVERGWQRARRTIVTADVVSFLAALVLWILAVGEVKGFAFTLGLTTIIDVFVVFALTKPLVTLLARTRFFGGGHALSGLNPSRLGARTSPTGRAAGRRRTAAKEA